MTSHPQAVETSCATHQCEKHGAYIAALLWPGKRPVWSKCPTCDAEAEAREKEAQRRRDEMAELERRRILLIESCIDPRFKAATFSGFMAETPKQRDAVEVVRAFAESFTKDGGQNLLLLGKPGTGKTHLASAAVRHAILVRGLSARIVGARDIVRELRDTWRRGATASESDVIASYVRPSLLALDDLGVGFGTEAEQVQLLDVIDARYRNLRPTIVTSNLNRPLLQKAIGERAFDRLQEGARVVPCDWPSYRKPLPQGEHA